MSASFVVVPQWQGSGSSRAMRLVDGADAIRGDLPARLTTNVTIPLEAGDEKGSGVARCSSLQLVRDSTAEALRGVDGWAITIGGDCAVELAPISHAVEREGAELCVVWLDAHGDLNTPESSPSGSFHGMVLRTLLGEGPTELVPAVALSPERVILAGTRSLDPEEERFVAEAGIRIVDSGDLTGLVEAIAETGASSVYLHIDLDVLDPAEFSSVGYPEPFGVSALALVETIRAIKSHFRIAGAGITEFAPSSPEATADDMPTILRIIGALATEPAPSA